MDLPSSPQRQVKVKLDLTQSSQGRDTIMATENNITEILVWNLEGMAIFCFADDEPSEDFKKSVMGITPVRMRLDEYPHYRQKCLREYMGGLDG